MNTKKFICSAAMAISLCWSLNSHAVSPPSGEDAVPDADLTPGVLCTDQDENFEEYYYDEQIARCKRSVGKKEKEQVAEEYGGIAQSKWPQYEFDHLIPLCAGGSDDIGNIWPEPISQAKKKDKVEVEVCDAMANGTMTQKQAVDRVMSFFQDLRNAKK